MSKSKALTWTTITTKLGDLIEYDKNPVQITEREAKELSKSLLKFNNVIPYVAAAPPNGTKAIPLLDGHQRKLVSMQINKVSANTMVEVRVPSRKLTEKEKQELIIRLRKNTGEFDYDKLANFFDVPDLLDWGFTEKELLGAGFEFGDDTKDAEPQINRAAELLKKWKVKKGDLWQIGDHRLICGDCTDSAVVARVMDGGVADLWIIDPPYGIDYNGESHPKTVEWDSIEGDKDLIVAKSIIEQLPQQQSAVIFGANCFPELLPHRGRWLCWDKRITEEADKMLGSAFELAWQNKTSGFDVMFRVLHGGVVNADGGKRYHPTQKPVELYKKIIEYYKANYVYDCCAGVGATLLSCQNLNRRGRAIEISPAYCAVTLQRMRDAFPDIEIKRIK